MRICCKRVLSEQMYFGSSFSCSTFSSMPLYEAWGLLIETMSYTDYIRSKTFEFFVKMPFSNVEESSKSLTRHSRNLEAH